MGDQIVGEEGQGGCDRRIKVFCENSKKNFFGEGGVKRGGGRDVNVNEELIFLRKFTKNSGGGGRGRRVVRVGGGGQGGCERRFEVFVNIKKQIGWGRVGEGVESGAQGGCDRRIEVFGKIHTQKKRGGREGVRWGSGWWGVRVDVSAMLGVSVMWGIGDVNQENKVLYNVQKGIVQF